MDGSKDIRHAPIATEEDGYNSASDEDFDPSNTGQAADDDPSSSDEEERSTNYSAKRRKLTPVIDADIDFENSGDEATIRKGKRRRRKHETSMGPSDDQDGGDGGLIKTRAQRAKEEMERKPLASIENATVDVDALWASMNGGSTIEPSTKDEAAPKLPVILNTGHRSNGEVPKQTLDESTNAQSTTNDADITLANKVSVNADDMVAIQRRYEFAGETITEEKLVPRSSAEARLYFQSEQSPRPTPPKPPLRRPKKRTSMFEPNLNGTGKGLSPTRGRSIQLNTIDKSKLDWAGYVDKEGIADELNEHSRAKEGYLGRMDFLGRVEAKREEDLKGARKK